MDVLIISDSKFFVEAIRFILMDSDGFNINSISYKDLVNGECSIDREKPTIVFVDLDCCSEKDKHTLKEELRDIVGQVYKLYLFSFDAMPIHETIKEFVETLHADGVIRRPISPKKVLEALGF
jgi:response regulator RpfG family c-di-GMP phosphodiesterase